MVGSGGAGIRVIRRGGRLRRFRFGVLALIGSTVLASCGESESSSGAGPVAQSAGTLLIADGSSLRLHDLSTGDATPVLAFDGAISPGQVAWSADGATIAFIGGAAGVNPTDIYVAAADDSNLRRVYRASSPAVLESLAFAPDGRAVAYAQLGPPRPVGVIDVATGVPIITVEQAVSPVWSPGSDRIAVAHGDGVPDQGELATVDLSSGTTETLTSDLTPVAWSPDGTRIAGNRNLRTVVVRSDGEEIADLADIGTTWDNAWAPDSSALALVHPLSTDNQELWIWEESSGGPRLVADDLDVGLGGVAWSPDGTQIAYRATSDTIRLVDRDGEQTGEVEDGGHIVGWRSGRPPFESSADTSDDEAPEGEPSDADDSAAASGSEPLEVRELSADSIVQEMICRNPVPLTATQVKRRAELLGVPIDRVNVRVEADAGVVVISSDLGLDDIDLADTDLCGGLPYDTPAGFIEYAPVLSLTEPGDSAPNQGRVVLGLDQRWYVIGEPVVSETSVQPRASLDPDSSDTLVLDLDAGNFTTELGSVPSACFNGAPSCPTRQIAVIGLERVLLAATVNQPEFADTMVVTFGDSGPVDARVLVDTWFAAHGLGEVDRRLILAESSSTDVPGTTIPSTSTPVTEATGGTTTTPATTSVITTTEPDRPGVPDEGRQGDEPVVAWDGEWRPAPDGRVVQLGQFGQQVGWLQEALDVRGYDVDIDGYFGYGTEATVRQFQRDRGLTVNGIATDEVWDSFGE